MFNSDLDKIEFILNSLNNSRIHYEDDLRVNLNKIPIPSETQPRAQTIYSLNLLADRIDSGILNAAEHLIGAMLYSNSKLPEPNLSEGPRRTLLVEWHETLSWLIYPSEVPYPIINVRLYKAFNDEIKSYRFANSLITNSLL